MAFENLVDRVKEESAQYWNRFQSWLSEQEWFIELKNKWEELGPENQNYFRYGALGLGAIGVGLAVLSSILSVYGTKSELDKKSEILTYLQAANQELRSLKAASGAGARSDDLLKKVDWDATFGAVGLQAGIDQAKIKIEKKKTNEANPAIKESLYTLSVDEISIKQIVRYVYYLEDGKNPVKVRNLEVNTPLTEKGAKGYLNAKIAVSAFTFKE